MSKDYIEIEERRLNIEAVFSNDWACTRMTILIESGTNTEVPEAIVERLRGISQDNNALDGDFFGWKLESYNEKWTSPSWTDDERAGKLDA